MHVYMYICTLAQYLHTHTTHACAACVCRSANRQVRHLPILDQHAFFWNVLPANVLAARLKF